MKTKEHRRRVREKDIEKFKADLGHKTIFYGNFGAAAQISIRKHSSGSIMLQQCFSAAGTDGRQPVLHLTIGQSIIHRLVLDYHIKS